MTIANCAVADLLSALAAGCCALAATGITTMGIIAAARILSTVGIAVTSVASARIADYGDILARSIAAQY